MKKNKKLLSALCAFPALVVSCIGVDLPLRNQNADQKDAVVVPVSLSCELLDTEMDAETSKSSHDMSALRKISNANYYVFEKETLVKQGYFEDAGDFAVTLPSKDGEYNLYILANVGKSAVDANTKESGMAKAVHVDYGSSANYFRTIEEYGFPMSAVISGFTASTSADLKLRRLVHTLYVTVDTEALESTKMRFTGLSVLNAARDVYPFAAESKAGYVMAGDMASVSNEDIEALNRGETVTLYVLENMRGTLFAGNSDWKKKVPGRMLPQSEQKYATYIELTAEAQTSTAHYSGNIYRAYLGTSPADCNVKRHSYLKINNRFTNDMIEGDGWRIESGKPVVNRTLAFVKNASGTAAVSEATTYPGFIKEFYIYRSDPDMEYTLTSDDSAGDDVWYTTEQVDDYYTRVMLCTDLGWDGSGISKEILTLKSSDGLITKTLTAMTNAGSNAYGAGITITPKCTYKYFSGGEEQHTDNIVLQTSTEFAEPVEIRITAGGRVEGYLKTWPDGTRKDPVEQTFSETISDQCSGYIGTSEVEMNFNLLKYFEKIHGNFSKSSLNKRNGDDYFMKHAHPTDLQLYYTVEFGKSKDGTLYPAGHDTEIPVNIVSRQIDKAEDEPFGAGTDWGILYWHTDSYYDTEESQILFVRYRRSIYGSTNTYEDNLRIYTEQRVNVKFNGEDEWTDYPPMAAPILL